GPAAVDRQLGDVWQAQELHADLQQGRRRLQLAPGGRHAGSDPEIQRDAQADLRARRQAAAQEAPRKAEGGAKGDAEGPGEPLKDAPLEAYTLGEIASRVHGTARGDASRPVTGIKPLDQAGPEDLSFVAHPRYRRAAATSRAAGLIAREQDIAPGRKLFLVETPYVALDVASALLHSRE